MADESTSPMLAAFKLAMPGYGALSPEVQAWINIALGFGYASRLVEEVPPTTLKHTGLSEPVMRRVSISELINALMRLVNEEGLSSDAEVVLPYGRGPKQPHLIANLVKVGIDRRPGYADCAGLWINHS